MRAWRPGNRAASPHACELRVARSSIDVDGVYVVLARVIEHAGEGGEFALVCERFMMIITTTNKIWFSRLPQAAMEYQGA
jgi:hypothetical protein